MTKSFTEKVTIREVGLRDGLQSISRILPTEQKQQWISGAVDAGITEIEVGSFVPAKLLPQLADTRELVAFSQKFRALHVSVLVPNLKGAELAIESGADLMLIPLSASREHSLANVRRTPTDMLEQVRKICAARDAASSPIRIEGGIGTAFGCTIQGKVPRQEVFDLLKGLMDAGVDDLSLADTVGYADPRSVYELFAKAQELTGNRISSGHFHDTRGLALANICAAMETGVTRFDASLSGIGGCPHAPGASGNVSTEDLVFMLESMGISTEISVSKLLSLRNRLKGWLKGETLHGVLWQSGLPKTFTQAKPA